MLISARSIFHAVLRLPDGWGQPEFDGFGRKLQPIMMRILRKLEPDIDIVLRQPPGEDFKPRQ